MPQAPTVVIGFSGALTIREAEEVFGRLREALETSERVEIDCSGVTEADITFIQLILAARTSAAAAGKTLMMSGPAGGALLDALAVCGLADGPQAPFWTEGRLA
ncbi:ABC-type transporter Mla MlaB component [Azospirillum fermentarium]|uniref:STAS domain-containing protein n=1 Tax=Azospirillum fermentarium TaxID=1233114 RepID=UPI002226C4CF|nr:STAS domain-containing protein [Azospirillum fermentarium]MCW2244425.1 ABC-type transporter Mla MlaB component [Azospirillum fermentarium]